VVTVNMFIPACPPKPEPMMYGVLKPLGEVKCAKPWSKESRNSRPTSKRRSVNRERERRSAFYSVAKGVVP
jgi:NADH:ubiquinone oxidoreductase subunit B-like Fe-S oxidoreductase